MIENPRALWYNNARCTRRCGGIGRRKGLKIPRWKQRTGSSPVTGTRKRAPFGVLFFCAADRGSIPWAGASRKLSCGQFLATGAAAAARSDFAQQKHVEPGHRQSATRRGSNPWAGASRKHAGGMFSATGAAAAARCDFPKGKRVEPGHRHTPAALTSPRGQPPKPTALSRSRSVRLPPD